MKITFVQPYYFNIWEALGLAYIGAYIKEMFQGELKIGFYQGYFDDDRSVIEGGKDSDIIAFSCTSPVFKHALELAKALKKVNPEIRTVFGGFHPSAVPGDCLEEEAIDQVVVGEGEEAFLKILNGETSSIVYGGPVRFGGIMPDRDLIKNVRTVDLCEQQVGKRSASFQSVRGCYFRCSFCAEKVITKNNVRERELGHLFEEIEWVASKYSLNYFKFVDATWNTSIDKAISFCEEKIRRGIELSWEANVHAAFVSKEMLEIMKKANCNQINVGCESGCQRVLNAIGKGITIEQIKRVFRWSKEIGIMRRGFFLLGMPNETMEDIKLTEKLVEEIQPDVFGVAILCPYPGCDFYHPLIMKKYNWSVADEYSNPYWRTKYFSNSELKKWQKHLVSEFSNNVCWHIPGRIAM